MSPHYDIVIVGAGASGAAAAWNLSKKFKRIACLEQGDWVKAETYPSNFNDWEIQKTSNFSPFPNVRKLESDYLINDSNSQISIANFNGVGGSTILYSGHFPRLHPSDFKTFSLDEVGHDWPISYKDLENFYNLNDEMTGVSGLEGDPAYPEIKNMQPPIAMGSIAKTLGTGFNNLGWHWWPSYSAIITREKDGRGACKNLGPCNTGCPQGAKSSSDITYWPKALKNGVDLITNSRVREVITDKQDKVKGVVYYDENGAEQEIKAKIVILACNGIGTPRILLNSYSNLHKEVLANRSTQVGKNLMLHPLGFVEGFFENAKDYHHGPHGSCILSQEFYETDESRGFKRGFTMQVLRSPEAIELASSGIQRRLISLGKNHFADFKKFYGKTAGISIICEDLPEETNRVILDDELKDSNGIACPKVFYKLGNNTKKMMSFGIERAKEVMDAAGASKTYSFGPVRNTGWHLMGTTRMGVDRETSVVNKYGMCHDVENLYIVDSSVFPTSGGVNPASSIQALALFITEQIKENHHVIN